MRIKASEHAKNGGKMTEMCEKDAKMVFKKSFPADGPAEECGWVYIDFYCLYTRTPSASLAE